MPDFGSFRGFGEKLVQGQTPTQLGKIGSENFGYFGMLDFYPMATVAYSLRLLRNGYTGSAIRVRRASDNTEQNIGFTLQGELDITALSSFCSGTNGFVTTWYDQSGNSKNATQTTAANQPQIVSSGTYLGYIQNGTASIDNVLISSFQYTASQDFSAFFTVQSASGSGAVFGGTQDGGRFYGVSQSGSNQTSVSAFTLSNYYDNGTVIGSTRNDIYNATTSFSVLTTLARANNADTFYLGYGTAGFFNNQRMKEIVIYNNQTVSRSGVESNTMTYYGL
jgi:hypothetical protein